MSPVSNIRNFSIIAHVDHGKSTLADRFLDLTGSVEKRKMREQFLDQMELERERGITIKLQPVRMYYKDYILNLIDTPGHADFSYEVSRSLAAVEGVILLVDATKGIQAQTFAHVNLAKKQNLVILPAVNKIDLPQARTDEVVKEVALLLSVSEKDVWRISAKEGTNIPDLLKGVVEKIPAPKDEDGKPFRALIFDSRFDTFKGVVAFVRVVEGSVKKDDLISLLGTGISCTAKEVGVFFPQETPCQVLGAGEIGYIATGVKEPESVRIGDTVVKIHPVIRRGAQSDDWANLALPGFTIPKPVVFVSFYPANPNEFDLLKDALSKLRLNDPSFSFEVEVKEALGRGFRCGFLGVLHSEIIAERLQREFHIELVISQPVVEITLVDNKGRKARLRSAVDWPQDSEIKETYEPWAKLEVLTPLHFFQEVSHLLQLVSGTQFEVQNIADNKAVFTKETPLREVIGGFYDRLKSATSGMASMDYELIGERKGDLVKLEFLVAGAREEALATIVPKDRAYSIGKTMVEKLKESLPPQLFDVALQALAEGRIIARETIHAQRKDVTAPLYGGDVTRKKKLLEIQKKGKKELKAKGKVIIPARVFLNLFRS
ncbi:MAG: GTP-binding protein LepA [Parcubacteria group bacterium Greene0714_21]|nr:MAG: GTP-binding protein LepA [Parcubacteria group bacterium Greene0416_39]TSC97845.1 MAG: GTP-binding protein LepA [Parcubacteria group bacterium Greene1014_47]TSD04561.1 MAG: GTP-binding protein LepA [Parcubacteria group bacterium Greene0714_21]